MWEGGGGGKEFSLMSCTSQHATLTLTPWLPRETPECYVLAVRFRLDQPANLFLLPLWVIYAGNARRAPPPQSINNLLPMLFHHSTTPS